MSLFRDCCSLETKHCHLPWSCSAPLRGPPLPTSFLHGLLLCAFALMFLFTRVLGMTRLFSTSAAVQFPKLKSHSGAKKRWRSIASGIFKRVCVPLYVAV